MTGPPSDLNYSPGRVIFRGAAVAPQMTRPTPEAVLEPRD